MALGPPDRRGASRLRSRRVVLALGVLTTAVVAMVATLAVAILWGATLAQSNGALARLELPPLAGSLESATARGPAGRAIVLSDRNGLLVPKTKLTPGETVSVEVVVRRPGWLGWALGDIRRERLTVRAPVARVAKAWLTLRRNAPLRVRFDQSVVAVAVGNSSGRLEKRRLTGGVLDLGTQAASGVVAIRVAARSWERLGPTSYVTWFPPSRSPILVASPAASTTLAPTSPIRLTFSRPIAAVLGSALPNLSPQTAGVWRHANSHTLVFTPAGTGFRLASSVEVAFPRAVTLSAQADAGQSTTTTTLNYTVAGGSLLRLQQLLAQAGYLPLNWTAAGAPVARSAAAEVSAALTPPPGTFSWRYPNTPSSLEALWRAGHSNVITKGAVMMFEDDHGLATDGIAGPEVWHALLEAAIRRQRHTAPYSYVYVHSQLPESLTLWSGGGVVLRSPGNTGIPSRPTEAGTFPVFEHLPVGTMSGTNPDGSHYHDPGIRYISYFNGGDAIHEYPRASYGTPQSLGCVELPLAAAARVYPYTPIGTLVTVEN
jgi:peptidoglycan hydrolase-like protein with peptidoglycan-binding domain